MTLAEIHISSDALFVGGLVLATGVIALVLWRRGMFNLGDKPGQQRDVFGVPAVVWLVCACVVFLSMQLAAGTVATVRLPDWIAGGSDSALRKGLRDLTPRLAGVLMGLMMLWLIREKSKSPAASGLTATPTDLPIALWALGLGLPAYLLIAITSQWLAQMMTGTKIDPVAHTTLKEIIDSRVSIGALVTILTAVLVAPLVEEILFRGFVQSSILSAFGRPWTAILGTSVLFTLVHVGPTGPVSWPAVPGLFFLSVVLGFVLERQRSLGACVLLHVLFNAANIAAALWGR